MLTITCESPMDSTFELYFQPLAAHRRGFAFPCDERGRVDLDHLRDRARGNYLFARALVGRDYLFPSVRAALDDAVQALPAAVPCPG